MKEREFHQQPGGEYTPPIDRERLLPPDYQHSPIRPTDLNEYRTGNEFTESLDSQSARSAQGTDRTSRKKILKMMTATVGTVVVLGTTGILSPVRSSPDADANSTTAYNHMFDEILEAAGQEDYSAIRDLMTSEEMRECIQFMGDETWKVSEYNNVALVYNGEELTDSPQAYRHNYEWTDRNLFINVYISTITNNITADSGEMRGYSYQLYFTPTMSMSEEYLANAQPFEAMCYCIEDYFEYEKSDNPKNPFPAEYAIYKATVDGYRRLSDYEFFNTALTGLHRENEDIIFAYLEPLAKLTAESWNKGPTGHCEYIHNEFDLTGIIYYNYYVDDNGTVIPEKSYRYYSDQSNDIPPQSEWSSLASDPYYTEALQQISDTHRDLPVTLLDRLFKPLPVEVDSVNSTSDDVILGENEYKGDDPNDIANQTDN